MNVTQKPSPNKWSGRFGHKPDMIVSHITDGAFDGAVAWLCNPASSVSAHFVVARDGRITQLVPLADGAWCNGLSAAACAGSTLAAVRERKVNPNYYTVSIEHEGVWNNTQGALTEAQLAATIELHRHIIAEVKRLFGVDIPIDREHLVGHYQISPAQRPNCPGQKFPWEALLAALHEDENETGDELDALRRENAALREKLGKIRVIAG